MKKKLSCGCKKGFRQGAFKDFDEKAVIDRLAREVATAEDEEILRRAREGS